MSIFDKENHLDKTCFDKLDTLSEKERIEFSDHLCSCDKCMELYTEYLQEKNTVIPPEETAFKAVKRAKDYDTRNNRTAIFKVFVSACFAFVILYSSVLPEINSSFESEPNNKHQEVSIFTKINNKLKENLTNININYKEILNSKGESGNEKK